METTVTQIAATGSTAVMETHVSPDGRRLVLDHRAKQPLQISLDKPKPVVVSAQLEGRTVTGLVRPVPGRPLTAIHAVVPYGRGEVAPGTVGDLGDDGTQVFELLLPPLPVARRDEPSPRPLQRRWAVRGEVRGKAAALTFASGADVVGLQVGPETALAVERTRRGNLGVIEWVDDVVLIRSAAVADGELVLRGRYTGRRAELTLHVKGMLGRTLPVTATRSGDEFTARLPLTAERGRFGQLPLQPGKYWLEAGIEEGTRTAVLVDRALAHTLPGVFEEQRLAGRLTRTAWGRLQLSVLTPRGEDVRSRAAQTRLAETSATLLPERSEGLLLRSYFGESATDNGLGLVRELRSRGVDMPIRWAVRDFSVPVPDGVEPVVHSSREWYRLLRTSRYYMDNMYQPVFHEKPAGQVLIQTFHGYPFKVMGHGHWEAAGFAQSLIDAYDRRTAEWDYMVSPAPYATPLLRREFRYEGEVLEIGYPRNDVLFDQDADVLRARVRESLGIRPDQLAVLYAPTFRDYVSQDNHSARLLDLVGMNALAEELGDGFVVLNRSHAFNARSGVRLGTRGTLLDVTDYPEVSDLYLAADAAVADYSSLRFDFAVTGKPMLFFVPDLDRYREARGWLLDYELAAPGPLLSQRANLVRELHDLDGVRERYRDQYDRFRRDFIPLEDGRASARLVDAVFVPRGTPRRPDVPPAGDPPRGRVWAGVSGCRPPPTAGCGRTPGRRGRTCRRRAPAGWCSARTRVSA